MDLGLTGGFDFLGNRYSRHPVKIVFSSDYDKYACEIYNSNFGHKCLVQDIRNLDSSEIPVHDLLVAGFPCQSFSIVAQNPPRLGYKDEKGRLFFELERILSACRPKLFLLENVKGLLSANGKKAFPLLIDSLIRIGYHVCHTVLNAADFGVPQRRERVFIFGSTEKSIFDSFRFPLPIMMDPKPHLAQVVDLSKEVDEKYFFSDRAVRGMIKNRNKMNKGRVQSMDAPCNTINAHLSKVSLNSTDPVLLHNGRYRRFTPHEVARIQSFPDTFEFPVSETRQYIAIGNAVPPVMMWYVAREIISAIEKSNHKTRSPENERSDEEKRSYNMSQIRSKDTDIEIILRKALWKRGLRYRKNPKDVIGRPDIVFLSKKIAVFCDSSFWHGKDYEVVVSRIKTNQKYWTEKIGRNKQRDKEVNELLRKRDWIVLRYWDVDIKKDTEKVVDEIQNILKSR